MKKAISILLAIATIAFATSAMAATATTSTSYNANSALPLSTSSMPTFRVGQTITITANSLDTNDGTLTVISYKDGATLEDAYVQYINQYDISSSSQTITYTIRDKETGVYHLELNDGTGKVVFYYTIGKVETALKTAGNDASNPDAYFAQPFNGKWSVGFIGKIAISYYDGGEIGDLGVKPGFSFTDSGTGKTSAVKRTTAITNSTGSGDPERSAVYELDGEATYLYGVTVYNITAGSQDDIRATITTE